LYGDVELKHIFHKTKWQSTIHVIKEVK